MCTIYYNGAHFNINENLLKPMPDYCDMLITQEFENVGAKFTRPLTIGKEMQILHNLVDECEKVSKGWILIACLQTAVAVSLLAGAILTGSVYLGIGAAVVSVGNYVLCNQFYSELAKKVSLKKAIGPWFCPSIETRRGFLLAVTLTWPLLSGAILPAFQALTWVQELKQAQDDVQRTIQYNLRHYIPHYSQHAARVIQNLDQTLEKSFAQRGIRTERGIKLIKTALLDQLDFLHQFSDQIPSSSDLDPQRNK